MCAAASPISTANTGPPCRSLLWPFPCDHHHSLWFLILFNESVHIFEGTPYYAERARKKLLLLLNVCELLNDCWSVTFLPLLPPSPLNQPQHKKQSWLQIPRTAWFGSQAQTSKTSWLYKTRRIRSYNKHKPQKLTGNSTWITKSITYYIFYKS